MYALREAEESGEHGLRTSIDREVETGYKITLQGYDTLKSAKHARLYDNVHTG